jgi:hypothetical protein
VYAALAGMAYSAPSLPENFTRALWRLSPGTQSAGAQQCTPPSPAAAYLVPSPSASFVPPLQREREDAASRIAGIAVVVETAETIAVIFSVAADARASPVAHSNQVIAAPLDAQPQLKRPRVSQERAASLIRFHVSLVSCDEDGKRND